MTKKYLKNNCLDCNKLCCGKYCRTCYLYNHNPSKTKEVKKKHSINAKKRDCFIGKNNPGYTDGRSMVINKCIDCGQSTVRYNASRCRPCSNLKIFYVHGLSKNPYPAAFNSKLKQKIRSRDDYICQNCNMTEEEHLSVLGINLTVHHIDYDKDNNSEFNLITTCLQCNVRANKNRNYWKEYYSIKVKV